MEILKTKCFFLKGKIKNKIETLLIKHQISFNNNKLK